MYIEQLKKKPHLIVITETWLKNEEIIFYNLKNYQSIGNCRENTRGGGILLYIRDDIKFNIVKSEQFYKSHLILINLNELNTKIAGFYRSPATTSDLFLEILENTLDNTNNLICLGDLNYDLLRGDDVNVKNYMNILTNNNYRILNKTNEENYTYFENKRGKIHTSILDHVFSDKFNIDDVNVETKDVCFSDHRLLIFECNLQPKKDHPIRRRTKSDFNSINRDLKSFDYSNNDFNNFMCAFTNSIKSNSKTKSTTQNYTHKIHWLDSDLKLELKKRKKLFKQKQENPNNDTYKKEFIKQKNKVKTKITEKRKEFLDSRFKNSVDNPKKFWNNINELLYNKSIKKNEALEIKDISGTRLNEIETANYFNNFFINLPLNTIENEYGNINNLKPNLTSKFTTKNSIFLRNVDENEIINIINKLKNSNSTGIDEITTKIIKECSDSLIGILPHYINNAFSNGTFPDCLKIAKVIPIYKKMGSRGDIKNFRPISLLNIISKIFEACLYSRLYSYLERVNFFNNNQFGFLKSSNTSSACISYIDKIQRALNDNKSACTIFLDVSKAFDCVDRQTLSKKLEQLGIRGNVLNLLNSYINNRKQTVQVNESIGDLQETKYGVAQGSKMGPLLFLIYVNDLFDLELTGNLQLYADDSSLTYISNNLSEIKNSIDNDLIKISDWFKNNLLVLNGDKTKILFYNSRRREIYSFPDIFLNNTKIIKVEEMKYLGLIIDSDLTWNAHINFITKKVSPYIGVFRRISFVCGDRVKLMLYYSFFYSNIIYMLSLWSGTKGDNIRKVATLQNKCIRNLFYNMYRIGNSTTDNLYKKFNIIKFEKIIELELSINFYKIINKKLKCDIKFTFKNNFHEHKTRHAKDIHKIKNKNKWGSLSFINRGIATYNNISSSIKKAKSANAFKLKLKRIILDKQFAHTINRK